MIFSVPQPRAAESQHWYTTSGAPAYEIKGTNGEYRPCTLRDARKLNLVPSVTSIIRCAAAPGLELWKIQQAILAALTLPRGKDENEKAWLDRVMEDSREQAKKAAERGTQIHAAIQGHYEGVPPGPEHWEHVKATARAIEEHFGKQQWVAEKSFAHPLGFGGKADLHCKLAVVDVKSKEFREDAKRLAWDEHCIQAAAYRVGLRIPLARGANAFVSTVKPGLVLIHEWKQDELELGWEMFRGLLHYWKAKNRYTPQFNETHERDTADA